MPVTLFATKARARWVALLEGSDACFAPVSTPREAMGRSRLEARRCSCGARRVLQAAPAPRFAAMPSRHPPVRAGARGQGEAILREVGLMGGLAVAPPQLSG